MGIFDKVAKTAVSVGKSALNVAGTVGSNATVAAQEQKELIELKSQVNVIEQELDASYCIIGRKFVDFVIASGEMPGIDVSDTLKLMEPKIEKKQDLEKKIIELEKEIKAKNVLREKQVAEQEFLAEKAKLDKALGMDLIDQTEYDAKLAIAQKKFDSFEALRKIDQQFEMKLITKDERDAKVQALLG